MAESATQEHDAVDEFAEVEQCWHTVNPAYQHIGLLAYWYAGRKVHDNHRRCSRPGHNCLICWSCSPSNIPGGNREPVLPSICQSLHFFGFMEIHKAGILEIKLAGIPEIIRRIMSSFSILPGETLLMEELTCKVK